MEKIIQISINSILFSLEEGAYNKLSTYINEIHLAFKDEQSGQEIIKDIEAGIAEHLKNSNKEAISIDVVEEIISKMGTVKELTGKNISDSKEESDIPETEKRKRLFRDEDHAILGGICAGIAAYLDIDTTWVRIAFIALIFLGFGAIIPIYIALWLIIPAAESVADKLEMRGNLVTLSTIANTVRDRVNEYSGKKCDIDDKECCKENKINTFLKKTRNAIRRIFMAIGHICAFFAGALISFVSLAILIGFTAGITAFLTSNISPEINGFILSSGAHRYIWLGLLASVICITIPSMFMFLGGITLIRRKPIAEIRYGFAIFAVWMVSIIVLVILGTHYGIKLENYMEKVDQRNGVPGYEQVQDINLIDFEEATTSKQIQTENLQIMM